MARRRTKKEKRTASLRLLTQTSSRSKEIKVVPETPKIRPLTNNHFYAPEISLPINLVISDLTKSAAVTILALIFQFALSAYLTRGGWQSINEMLHKIIEVY